MSGQSWLIALAPSTFDESQDLGFMHCFVRGWNWCLVYYWPNFLRCDLGQINVTLSLRSFEDMNKYQVLHKEIKQSVKFCWYLWATNCMLDLCMIDWVDDASAHILKIHLDFIPEHVIIFFSAKLIKRFNFLRWIRVMSWRSWHITVFTQEITMIFFSCRGKEITPKTTKVKYSWISFRCCRLIF